MGLVSDVTVISAGDKHTCAIHNGAAKCWGNNEDGRLGDSTTSSIVSGALLRLIITARCLSRSWGW